MSGETHQYGGNHERPHAPLGPALAAFWQPGSLQLKIDGSNQIPLDETVAEDDELLRAIS